MFYNRKKVDLSQISGCVCGFILVYEPNIKLADLKLLAPRRGFLETVGFDFTATVF